jgi:hypothetical protein
MSKSRNPGYQGGNNWGICDRCGQAYRQTELVDQHDGLRVCVHDCYDKRHPQEAVRDKGWECGGDGAQGTGLDWNGAGRLARPDVDPLSFIQEPNDAYFTTIPEGTFGIGSFTYAPYPTPIDPCAEDYTSDVYEPSWWFPVSEVSGTCGVSKSNVSAHCDKAQATFTNSDFWGAEDLRALYQCNGANGEPYIAITERNSLVSSSYLAFYNTDPKFTIFLVVGNVEGLTGCLVTMDSGTSLRNQMGLYRHQYEGQWHIGFNDFDYDAGEYVLYRGVPVGTAETAMIRIDISDSGLLMTKNAGEVVYQTNLMDIPTRFRTFDLSKYWGGNLLNGTNTGSVDFYELKVFNEYNGLFPPMTEEKVRRVEEYLSEKFAIPIPTPTVSYPEYIHAYYYQDNS